jgi:hypothetical protein
LRRNLRVKFDLEDMGTDRRIILKRVFNNYDRIAGTFIIFRRIGTSDAVLFGNKPFGLLKCGKFPTYVKKY